MMVVDCCSPPRWRNLAPFPAASSALVFRAARTVIADAPNDQLISSIACTCRSPRCWPPACWDACAAGRRALLSGRPRGGLRFLTVKRNEDYQTAAAIWGDTVAKSPNSALSRTTSASPAAGRTDRGCHHHFERACS